MPIVHVLDGALPGAAFASKGKATAAAHPSNNAAKILEATFTQDVSKEITNLRFNRGLVASLGRRSTYVRYHAGRRQYGLRCEAGNRRS